MNILIAEDDEAIANLLYMDLSDEGYQCSVAGDGKIAADMLEANMNYDLILLDIMLPEIDGYELLEYIKPTGIPVIFLTAKGTVNDRIRGLKLGADDYIVKPFSLQVLLLKVKNLIAKENLGVECYKDLMVDKDAMTIKRGAEVIHLKNIQL